MCKQVICEENLAVLAGDQDISSKIVTSHKTLMFHWKPPTKQDSMQTNVQWMSTIQKTKTPAGKLTIF